MMLQNATNFPQVSQLAIESMVLARCRARRSMHGSTGARAASTWITPGMASHGGRHQQDRAHAFLGKKRVQHLTSSTQSCVVHPFAPRKTDSNGGSHELDRIAIGYSITGLLVLVVLGIGALIAKRMMPKVTAGAILVESNDNKIRAILSVEKPPNDVRWFGLAWMNNAARSHDIPIWMPAERGEDTLLGHVYLDSLVVCARFFRSRAPPPRIDAGRHQDKTRKEIEPAFHASTSLA